MKSCVFITGAAGGLGRCFVDDAARRGWDLFLTDIPGTPLAELAESTERTYGVNVQYQEGDLSSEMNRDDFFSELRRRDVQFHFLINVAGIEFEGDFLSLPLSSIRRVMSVNMDATLEVTHQVMQKRDPSRTFRIITVSSLSYFYPIPSKAIYSASKRFLYNFFHALREEVRSLDATVTILCPAGMPTKEVVRKRIESQGFMGRITTLPPDLVARKTVDRALKGRAEFIPGRVNRFLVGISWFMTEARRARVLKVRWDRANSRQAGRSEPAGRAD